MRRRDHHPISLLLFVALAFASGCVRRPPGVHAELVEVATRRDPTALCNVVETLIDQGQDRRADREYAYEQIRQSPEETAAYYYALASITGRLVQDRGLLGAGLVADVERAAEHSRALDPDFQGGAATRLLGTLYVFAPPGLLDHGDSESGLALLEHLTAAKPDVIQNHLRLAEAYIALSDPTPAQPHLCRCLAQRGALRPDDARLLDQLVRTGEPVRCPPTATDRGGIP